MPDLTPYKESVRHYGLVVNFNLITSSIKHLQMHLGNIADPIKNLSQYSQISIMHHFFARKIAQCEIEKKMKHGTDA